MKKSMAEYGRIFFIGFVSSFIFAIPALGWESCPVCQYWSTSQNRCVNKASGGDCGGHECSKCYSGECINDSSDCEACERCDLHECWDLNCDPGECESCVDHRCKVCGGDTSKACCEAVVGTCYDWATEQCCDGLGNICPDDKTCCDGACCDPSTERCCDDIGGINDGYCCPSGEDCCDGECCGENQYCCKYSGGGECCNADEVCCWDILTQEGYCNPPCSIEVVDTTSCSEANEDTYKCNGCQQLTPPTCSTWRDYTGLQIKECSDGCLYTVPDEVCYYEKDCFPMLHENSLCLECEGEELCLPIIDPLPIGGDDCATLGTCIIDIACDILFTCFQCEEVSEVVGTFREETCTGCS